MYLNHSCPRCSTPIPPERLVGSVVVCSCGWTGNKAKLTAKPTNPHIKRAFQLGILLLIGFLVYDGSKWKGDYPQKAMYSILSTLKMTSATDDANFGKLCSKLGKHGLAVKAYTKAFTKAPKNYKIAGELAEELVHVKKYERAVLTYQNFFSYTEGTAKNKRYFAKALAGGGYADDATEWYYQALKQEPDYFIAAKELILHLSKSNSHAEALSVLGHYQMVFPKTRKGWKALTQDIKAKYEAYNGQFKVEELKISGLSKYLFAPVQMGEGMETQVFMVDKESEYLTIDAKYLDSRNVQHKEAGKVELSATSGKSIEGKRVILPELNVGGFTVKNVKAVACDNCAFLLGKQILKRLNFKQADKKGVKYITLHQ